MNDNLLQLLNGIKWIGLFLLAFIASNWFYFWTVILTFLGNYWYRQKFCIVLTRFEWVKLFFIGAAVSLTIFEALTNQIDNNMARGGATAFIAVIGMEVYPILIQVLKDITPAMVKKKAGVKQDD